MRRKDRPVHELPSFARYLNKVFDFRAAAAALSDSRCEPEIPPSAVFLAAFHGFAFRLPSFQQLEAELTQPALQQWIGADRAFRDDVLRYSLSGFQTEGLERMLVQVNRTLKRNKAFDAGRVQGRIVAALDGIEVLSSYSRCCDSCLERRVFVRKAGVKVEQLQYYHRAVGCQIVSSPTKPFLALEWLQPGEGEDTAALRLLGRLPDLYGSRFFDILLLDALYAQAPVLQLAEKAGWDLVITLKQNQRDLYQSATRLFARRPADSSGTERQDGKSYQFQIWDTEGLPFSADYPQPVRVVRSEETLTQNHYRRRQLEPDTTAHEWLWITTLDSQTFPPELVRRLGHDRWKQENNGWNDLTQNWAFKHGFLHACRHRPRTVAENGEQQPVPNRGLAAVTLILLLAFTLCAAFTQCHSKLVRRYRLTAIEVARQLRCSLSKLPPNIRAPDCPAPAPQTT
ncbi:MAG: transposase [Acidobacteria bacterium]|nr:transposase [Acidobacteriota bacterium]